MRTQQQVAVAQDRARRRVLEHLSVAGHYLAPDPLETGRFVMVAGQRQPSVVRGSIAATVVSAMQADDLLRRDPGAAVRWRLTEAGLALARRVAAGPDGDPFQTQHQHRRIEAVGADDSAGAGADLRLVNDSESPLAWLHRRKDRAGRPLLDAMRFAAGERLRADLTRASSLPRLSANWSAAVAADGRHAATPDPTEAMVAAQQRVRRALDAVGSEFAGLLIDVCGFLKGLADIERERHWPARSGKVVLDIALGRLAAHYGLSAMAVGVPAAPDRLAAWMAPDARPVMARQEAADAAAS